MITPNTKVTALEILQECEIKDAENVFGNMRVRIGGIMGITGPQHLINIPAEATEIEVIVGNEVIDLVLSEGNEENNAEIRVISDEAKVVLEAEGKEATEKSEELQAVKQLARKIQDSDGTHVPTKEEVKHLERAIEIVEAEEAVEAAAEEAEKDTKRTIIVSK